MNPTFSREENGLLLMLKPANLAYVLLGFGKPKDKTHVPEY
ncbi:MAG: hypothetical protein ABSD38_09460 [Syntrophorhabdales bacterium]|jgi:hypothetical protein